MKFEVKQRAASAYDWRGAAIYLFLRLIDDDVRIDDYVRGAGYSSSSMVKQLFFFG